MKDIPRYFKCKPASRKRHDVEIARTAEKFLNYVYHGIREKLILHVLMYGNEPVSTETMEQWLGIKKKRKR